MQPPYFCGLPARESRNGSGRASESNGEHRHTAAGPPERYRLTDRHGSQCARKMSFLSPSVRNWRSLKEQLSYRSRCELDWRWDAASHADPQNKTDISTAIEEARHVAGAHPITYLATRDRGGKREGRLGENHGRDAYRDRANESRPARGHDRSRQPAKEPHSLR